MKKNEQFEGFKKAFENEFKGLSDAEIKQHYETFLEQEKLEKIKQAKANVSKTIYQHYTKIKQAQDGKWWSSSTTKFTAWGVDIEKLVYLAGVEYFKGEKLDTLVKKFVDSLTEEVKSNIKNYEENADISRMFRKLLKIAIKTEWADRSIGILINNIKNNTNVSLSDFPTFD